MPGSILTPNAGSSRLRFALFDAATPAPVLRGAIDRSQLVGLRAPAANPQFSGVMRIRGDGCRRHRTPAQRIGKSVIDVAVMRFVGANYERDIARASGFKTVLTTRLSFVPAGKCKRSGPATIPGR